MNVTPTGVDMNWKLYDGKYNVDVTKIVAKCDWYNWIT